MHSFQARLGSAALVAGIATFFVLLTSAGRQYGLTFTGSATLAIG